MGGENPDQKLSDLYSERKHICTLVKRTKKSYSFLLFFIYIILYKYKNYHIMITSKNKTSQVGSHLN